MTSSSADERMNNRPGSESRNFSGAGGGGASGGDEALTGIGKLKNAS
jgi:hypothetical protein